MSEWRQGREGGREGEGLISWNPTEREMALTKEEEAGRGRMFRLFLPAGSVYWQITEKLSDSHIKSHPSDGCVLSAESVLVREPLQCDLKINRGDQVLLNLNEETLNT